MSTRKLSIAAILLLPSFLFGSDAPPGLDADAAAIAVSEQRIARAIEQHGIPSPGQLVVVYFTANDRPPAADYVARIRRIITETAGFYESELARHGFPNRTLNVRRDDDGKVSITTVTGQREDKDYGKSSGQAVRREVVEVLRKQGVDADRSVLLMFCNMMDYDPINSTITHHSPYYGGGSHLSGNAWQCDSEILDPKRFTDPTPLRDGQYGRITIGRHNSIFIGGTIHELGHALSLPHCRQRADQQQKSGIALMGSGNRTYAQQLRGEGPGTFLTLAHAFRLAAHPVFHSRVHADVAKRADVNWSNLRVGAVAERSIGVRGQVSSPIPVHAVVAYFDPDGGGDYDATTATAVPADDGTFALRSGPLRAGKAGELRLFACHINGSTSRQSMRYAVEQNGTLDLTAIRLALELKPMIEALRRNDLPSAGTQLDRIAQHDRSLRQLGQRVLDRFATHAAVEHRRQPLSPADVPAGEKTIPLSRCQPADAEVGWLRPTYDAIADRERLLSVAGDYYASGIYAHAPAAHRYQLGGNWQRLTGQCGMQTGRLGKVDFRIVGDGKELWSARGVEDGPPRAFQIDLTAINTLELIVTDGGNGKSGDWGVWIEPTLHR
jgi:hypothetical protein